MKSQPNRNYVSNDDVQTPLELARVLVAHFKPSGRILEPCRGDGNFSAYLPKADWCEIKKGRDFFSWTKEVDWIVTNPPWSLVRDFLQHSMKVSNHVVFLVTVNHLWTKARIRDIKQAGFGLKEIVLVDMPKSFPQSGFQLGAVYLSRGWRGSVRLTDLMSPPARAGGQP